MQRVVISRLSKLIGSSILFQTIAACCAGLLNASVYICTVLYLYCESGKDNLLEYYKCSRLEWWTMFKRWSRVGFFWLHVGLFSVFLSYHRPHFSPTLLDTIAAKPLCWWACPCSFITDKGSGWVKNRKTQGHISSSLEYGNGCSFWSWLWNSWIFFFMKLKC